MRDIRFFFWLNWIDWAIGEHKANWISPIHDDTVEIKYDWADISKRIGRSEMLEIAGKFKEFNRQMI